MKVRVVKNKVAPPFKIAEFDILFGEGISSEGCLLDVAAELDVVKKSGTWYSYGDEKLGQGRDKAREYLKENPQILSEIEIQVRNRLKPQPIQEEEKVEEPVTSGKKQKAPVEA